MATTKISELNPLASGSTCAAAVLPIVNDGVTDKISIDNLRGTLRGASNQGPANTALNGGINNAACRLGDGVFGGQGNTVNGNFLAKTAADGNYNYNGPEICSSGSVSSIIGGLANKIEIASAKINAGYPLAPSTIINSVGSCITGSATSAYCAWYAVVGGDMIIGGHGNTITGPTANGNYASGMSMVLGSYSSNIDTQASNVDDTVGSYNNAVINSWSATIKKCTASSNWFTNNQVLNGGSVCILSTDSDLVTQMNTIIGGNSITMVDSKDSAIIAGKFHCLERASKSVMIGGNNNYISGSTQLNEGIIVGGRENCIVGNHNRTVIAGGCQVTSSVDNALHIQELVFKTGAQGVPTADPVHAGRVWNDGGTLKISLG